MVVDRMSSFTQGRGTAGFGRRTRVGGPVARAALGIVSLLSAWRCVAAAPTDVRRQSRHAGQRRAGRAEPPARTAPPLVGPQPAPPPPPDPEIARAAERAERDAVLRAAREEAEASLDAETLIRAAETADLRGTVQDLKEQLAPSKAAETPPSVRAARLGLGLTGYVQADLAFRQSSEDQINTSTGDPLNEDRFMIRRARLRATLDRTYVAGRAGVRRQHRERADGAHRRRRGVAAACRAPAAQGTIPLLMATIGLFKIPFGFEIDRERPRPAVPGAQHHRARAVPRRIRRRRAPAGRLALPALQPGGRRTASRSASGRFPSRDPNHQKDWIGRLGIDGGEGSVRDRRRLLRRSTAPAFTRGRRRPSRRSSGSTATRTASSTRTSCGRRRAAPPSRRSTSRATRWAPTCGSRSPRPASARRTVVRRDVLRARSRSRDPARRSDGRGRRGRAQLSRVRLVRGADAGHRRARHRRRALRLLQPRSRRERLARSGWWSPTTPATRRWRWSPRCGRRRAASSSSTTSTAITSVARRRACRPT